MHRISYNLARKLTAVVSAAALLTVALGSTADAAVPKTGVWTGELVPSFKFIQAGGDPWKPRMTLTALNGRIMTVATTVRMECETPLTVQDIRVLKSWRVGTGPKISTRNGGFSFSANGVYIHGTLSKTRAMGGASITKGENCLGQGRFNIPRGKY